MEQNTLDRLGSIVGEGNVCFGPKAAQGFLRPGQEAPNLVVVSPSDDGEVQKIVEAAREHGVGIVTANDRRLLEEDLRKEGILLDFSRMDKIERIDPPNLIAHVQRGVTWDQLNRELKKQGLRTVAPVAANSASVAESCAARVVGKAAAKYWDYPVTNLRLVLANGHIHKTGTHGFDEEASDGRSEGGPNLSNWFTGSDDMFGVMTRATIMLWPVYETRTCLAIGFDDRDELLTAMRDLPRTELGVEYLGINRAYLKNLLGGHDEAFAPWILVVGLEGRSRLVEHHRGRILSLLKQYNCSREEHLIVPMTEQLDRPWMEASENHTAFFTLFPRLKEMDAEVDRAAASTGVPAEVMGKVFVSFDCGRAVYAVYDWFHEPYEGEALRSLNLALSDLGACFERPHGELGRKIYTSIPNHLPVLKHIKGILDPENVLNPGRILSEEDPDWRPLEVGSGETGLTVSNVREVKEKISRAVGEEWVSDNPADLSSYGRDFTIFSGERPNLVVMPASTEEVQAIVRIAYEHGIPVVPQCSGFNHGGLSIPRKGGILVDLRRMDQVCSIDEESMTVTVGPALRMRYVWWEVIRHRATDGSHLKPILPMTFGSVSLLSNYISRGGAGMAVKYGINADLSSDMTWVLPNGEILKVGASAIPKVGKVGLHYMPGPDLFGMFFNADGMFGICTELTAKLYPERDNADELEEVVNCAHFGDDHHRAFCLAVEAIREIAQQNVADFMYKAHPGMVALTIVNSLEGLTVPGVIGMSPQHPLAILICGYDAEEKEIKKEIVSEIVAKHGLMVMDPAMFGMEMQDMAGRTDALKRSLGVRDNFLGTYQGAFQWTACFMKLEKIPQYAVEYEALVRKYWKTSDPTISAEHAMTGTDIQGPLPFGRFSGVEIDFWWDQGNPESVKRATVMMHKAHKLMLQHGGFLYRNMFGSGEYHLPLWGEYYDILKKTKKAFDPANLMHPDVLPITDDYV
jgi:FAD/FMN-containing dehydrogenase